jgi:hypothetical protein
MNCKNLDERDPSLFENILHHPLRNTEESMKHLYQDIR